MPRPAADHWPALVLLLLVGLVLVGVPLAVLVRTGLEEGAAALLEATLAAGPAILATTWTSVAATMLALATGTFVAVVTERTTVPGRRGLRLAMLLALVVPGYVAALGWVSAYGPGGLLDDVFGLAAPGLVGPAGIVAVMAAEAAPIAYLMVVAGLRSRAEPDLERAARASGASAPLAFFSVTLPLLRPVLAGAAAIVLVLCATSFGVPAVLGIPAGFTTMTTRIYRDLAFSSDPVSFAQAIGLAVLLAAGAVAVIVLGDRILERGSRDRSGAFGGPLGVATLPSTDDAAERSPAMRGRSLAGSVVAWSLVLVMVALPLLGLLLTALARAPGLPPVPTSWTLDNFRTVLDAHTLAALAHSLLLAAAAAIGVVVLALLAVAAGRGRGRGATSGALAVTFALPGSTLAVAVLLAYGASLRDTLLIILVAYLAKFWALGYRPVAAGLEAVPEDARRAARISGAGAWTTLRTVTLPAVRPMLLAGALIVFMFGLHEVTMSSLLYGPGSATLAVVVLNLEQLGDASLTAALALLLTVLVMLAGLPLLWRSRARSGGGGQA